MATEQERKTVVVVRTGTANTASVLAGLERAGAVCSMASSATEVDNAHRVVLPGVGTFGAAMERLVRDGLVEPLRERIRQGRPTLAICVGLQVLCERSDESPDSRGLGCIPSSVGRFGTDLKVPQIGWNRVTPAEGDRSLLTEGYAYFANSFRLTGCPDGWIGATTDYGGPFLAALERGAVLACQFHPELSGSWGLSLLRRWLEVRPC